jgi:hypothetical protein
VTRECVYGIDTPAALGVVVIVVGVVVMVMMRLGER